jgi:two-component system, OmpR family, sensor histidine kinase BaeS
MNTPEHTLKKTGPGPLRRGLDTLRVKLFLAIAGAHLVLVAAVYLIYSSTVDSSLVEYVKRSEQDRLSPVIQQLADGYEKNGNWTWLNEKNREPWWGLLREVLGWRGGRPAQANTAGPASASSKATVPGTAAPNSQSTATKGADKSATAPPNQANMPRAERPQGERGPWNFQGGAEPPLTIDFFRLMLFDVDGKVLILNDPRQDAATAEKLPIRVDGRVVGYLGYIPRLQQVESLESITRKQQANRIQVIGVGMFVTVLIIAAMIAHWLTLRLGVLGAGATALARGDYATRIPVQGHDELARLAGDFNHLAEALGAAQRGRQQWIADIAHELRTPLTALRAEIEAVQDGVRPLTQASIASVAHEVHRLTRLVEDLRLLSLSDLGALTTRKEPLELDEAIADALALGRAAIEQKPLGVELRLTPDIVIDADPDRVSQVFSNLLQNTLRYTETPAFLHIGLTVDGREARIDWEDSSPGVGDADLPHLTERLYRVDASRSSASGGSGLGLAIVQAIVQAHGGRMQAAHSALGGLHWRIWLPLSDHRPA